MHFSLQLIDQSWTLCRKQFVWCCIKQNYGWQIAKQFMWNMLLSVFDTGVAHLFARYVFLNCCVCHIMHLRRWCIMHWCLCLSVVIVVGDLCDVKLRQYSSVGSLPGKLSSVTSPLPNSSESVVARVYLCSPDSHITNQYKSIIVSIACR